MFLGFRGFVDQATRRLTLPDSAEALHDLAGLPSNRPEALRGNRTGQQSIRINQQWRICFRWEPDGPCEVEIVDYHWRWEKVMRSNGMRPVHPGEILREELQTLDLSANALSKALDVPVNRVTTILNGQRGVTADTALRLARYFGTTPQVWLNLQQTYDLRRAEIAAGPRTAERVRPRDTAA